MPSWPTSAVKTRLLQTISDVQGNVSASCVYIPSARYASGPHHTRYHVRECNRTAFGIGEHLARRDRPPGESVTIRARDAKGRCAAYPYRTLYTVPLVQ